MNKFLQKVDAAFANKKIIIIILCVVTMGILINLSIKCPLFSPDSAGYIAHSAHRAPLYPLFISLLSRHYHLIISFQGILLIIALFNSANFMKNTFKIPNVFALFYFIRATLLVKKYSFSQYILTEGIALPLFIFWFIALANFLIKQTKTNFAYFLLFSAMLLLLRPQFYFIYGIFAALLFLRIFIKHFSLSLKTLFIGILSCVILVNIVGRTYHYIYNGSFSMNSQTGQQLIVSPFYFSTQADAKFLKDPLEKKVFTTAYKKAISNKLLFNTLPINKKIKSKDVRYHYQQSFNSIIYTIISSFSPSKHDPYTINKTCLNLTWQLFKLHPTANIKFFLYRIQRSFGGHSLRHIILLLLLLAYFIFLAKSFSNFSSLAIVTFLSISIVILNNLLITFSNIAIPRCLIYNKFLLLFNTYLLSFLVILYFPYQKISRFFKFGHKS
ncbi:MAG: hypothetical protein PVG30_06800 [Gammaproteobacteria bacterium]